MAELAPHGVVNTDTTPASHAPVTLPTPKFWLDGRIAAGFVGNVGYLYGITTDIQRSVRDTECPLCSMIDPDYEKRLNDEIKRNEKQRLPDLHLTLIIEDGLGSTWGVDGQPVVAMSRSIKTLKSNYYINKEPGGLVFRIEIFPPKNMSPQVFRQKLMENAKNFPEGVFDYSAPEGITGSVMKPGEYNSSSYMAGLINSVAGMDYVKSIKFPSGYKSPGWESVIPESAFAKK
ncbi:hypothetical protein [Paraburkholderia adhaesiva]|uniref:hypothetical protein n=1 Tax=Paraburkholderia adhaesiva TaxID=2883244 RepID=UPI001F2938FB|nr:hypothetical protein [Paraburkholderia adhaesiva]